VSSPDERRSAWPGGRDLVLGILFALAVGIVAGLALAIVAALFAP
jgi:hypothetical protein